LIAPGELSSSQNFDPEYLSLAQWLNARGIAAFVLRNRGAAGYPSNPPDDAVPRALKYLRTHAADFHLSANRIGVMGFGPGATQAENAAAATPPSTDSANPLDRVSARPDFLVLIDGGGALPPDASLPPPTFLVGSTNNADNLAGMIDLWNTLRNPRSKVPVEAHFFPKAEADFAPNGPVSGSWPDLFYNWVRAYGFLTDQPRVAIRGSVQLDGRPLPHGYLIFTPIDQIGAGPIIAHVFNSTQGVAIGSFALPANQGPVPGHYKVDVRQNANRWLSNSFSADLIRDPAFGHSRNLSPSIDDQHSYTKVHPGDKDDLVIDIKPEGNSDFKIEVFSK